MLQGIDLLALLRSLPAHRAFNVIDTLIIEEAVRNGNANSGIEKARTEIFKVYNSSEGSSNDEYGASHQKTRDQPPTYTEQTDDGFIGLEPPLG